MQNSLLRTRGLVAAVLFLSASLSLLAQTVSGVLTDADTGDPLIGASVLAVGTSTGTITDFDGNYSLEVPEGVTQLQFSYTGYATRTEEINGRSTISLEMSAGQILEEVVVVGYGTTKKDDLTGAVEAIETEDFNRGAIVSPQNLISGKVAGVQISTNSGNPGEAPTVRIRGASSINAGNDPLYVVDGVPLSGGGVAGGRSPLNFLNPNDIATMTILKDASAAAIYGSRGANGVIIITTKQGTSGEPRISYDGNVTTSSVIGEQQNLDPQAFRNVVTFAAPNRLEQLGNANTNWFDQVTQNGFGTQHSLSISGGGETNTYRASAGYQQLEGVLQGAETERVTLALNLTQRLFDEKLRIQANVKGARTANLFDAGVVGAALGFDPTQPVFDPDNTEFAGFFDYGVALAPRNPVSSTRQIRNEGQTYQGVGNLDLKYDFDDLVPGLSYTAIVGFDVQDGQSSRFVPTTYATIATNGFNGEFNNNSGRRTSSLFDTYFNYAREFGTQRAEIQVGYSYQNFRSDAESLRGFNLQTDAFGADPSIADDFQITRDPQENRLISFFGRLNYNINERYLITASLRRDGDSSPPPPWPGAFWRSPSWRDLTTPFPILSCAWATG